MDNVLKGRGAHLNPANRFLGQSTVTEHIEGIDEPLLIRNNTQFFIDTPAKIISRNSSPDIPFEFSINPYQGCEHGCAYCYARNSHEYWGFSAGLDFESKIIIKPAAPELLAKTFLSRSWKPASITLSGNTDCYQPIERKLKITRGLLQVFAGFRNPVGIITKNVLILRDLDILKELAENSLVHVFFSVSSLDETLRSRIEPRTASIQKKLFAMERLSKSGIPVGVMIGPVIPGLNDHEIPSILKAAAASGATNAGYNMLRLNGAISEIFSDWLKRNYADRAQKIWNQVSEVHGGDVNDSRWGRRLAGEGKVAESVKSVFQAFKKKYMQGGTWPPFDLTKFRKGGNLTLF